MAVTVGAVLSAPNAWAATVTYSATQTIPVPPASSFEASAGGDGWGLAFTNTAVYNVFHHDTVFTVACHEQVDASACWDPETLTDPVTGSNFSAAGQPGLWIDPATGKLYAFTTRVTDETGGVVCFDTTAAGSNPDPFCGFTALTAPGEAPIFENSALSDMAVVGTRMFGFNYATGAAVSGTQNKLLCFDLTTDGPCAGQPFAVALGAGPLSNDDFPEPAIAAFGSRIIVPDANADGGVLGCFDTATNATCTGSWPVAAPDGYPGSAGAPIPLLTAAGAITGFCLPTGADECYSLTGATVATPSGMPGAITTNSNWDGPAVVIGPREYVANGDEDQLECYDANTNASCTNFPHATTDLVLMYTVTRDPQRPTCLWLNSDNGDAQIQNLDAFTGGACGEGDIRVLASSFVVPTVLCQPATYTSLQILAPARNTYTGGTVSFQDGDANPIPGIPDRSIDATGSVDLTGLNLSTATGLPQFVIALTGTSGNPTSVTVKLTWTGVDDPSCQPGGGPPPGQTPTTTTVTSSAGRVIAGTPVTFTATVTPTDGGGTVTFTSDGNPIPGCTNVALNASGKATCTTSSLPAGSHVITATYSGDASFQGSSGQLVEKILIPVMTGRAFGIQVTAGLLSASGTVLKATPDTGLVTTSATTTKNSACLNVSIAGVVAHALCGNVTTVGAPTWAVAATSRAADVTIGLAGLPVIVLQGLSDTSATNCSGHAGSFTLAYLKIGTTVIISKPTVIAPNRVLNAGVAKLTLNEQIGTNAPTPGAFQGLTVNAVHLKVNALNLVKTDVIVSSSFSGISNCP